MEFGKKSLLLLIVALFSCSVVGAKGVEPSGAEQEEIDPTKDIKDIAIYYEHDRAWPRWDYSNNRQTYDILVKVVYSLSKQKHTRAMVIEGAASPIGSEKYNHNLALRRAQVLRGIISRMEGGDKLMIEVVSTGEDWETFHNYVAQHYDKPNREQVLEILRKNITNDEKEGLLKALDRHKTWRLLVKEYMASARNAAVIRFVEISDLLPKKPVFEGFESLIRTSDFTRDTVRRTKSQTPPPPPIEPISIPMRVTPIEQDDLSKPKAFKMLDDVATADIAIDGGVSPIDTRLMTKPQVFRMLDDVADEDFSIDGGVSPITAQLMTKPLVFGMLDDVVEEDVVIGNGISPIGTKSMTKPTVFRMMNDMAGYADLTRALSMVNLSDLTKPEAPTSEKLWRYPVVALRTNLLVPALNFGVEVPIGKHWSVGADYYYPWVWPKRDNINCFEFLAWGIEGRYWFGRNRTLLDRLQGHSVGVYGYMGYFDFERNYNGHQGEFVNVGVDYTYAMAVGKKKGLHFEFSLGIGYIYSLARQYTVIETAGPLISNKVTRKINYFGPTKANVSLVVPIFKKISPNDRRMKSEKVTD